MVTDNIKFLAILLLLVNTSTSVKAQNWPCWRGPSGDGTCVDSNVPTEWDSVKNVQWKSPVPGIGHSSPIIWENKLFLTSALPESNEKILLCYDSRNGKLLWKETVVKTTLEKKHSDNSYASGTPATDGKLVYISFLDEEEILVAAYDFKGKQVWEQRPGTYSSPHGYSVSPTLYEDKVIINGTSKGENFFAALSKSDGHIIWKKKQETLAHSWSTPFILEKEGKIQLILLGNSQIASYDPNDGSKFWFVNGPAEDFCSTPVYNEKHDLLITSSAWRKRILIAIDPNGKGDVSESHVRWQTTQGAMYVPSPLSTGDYLFTTQTNGKVYCTDIPSGDTLWVENLGKQYASPVLTGGLVYMPNDEGVITVIKPGPKYNRISQNDLGEGMIASAAISRGKIFLRGEKHLYCIGKDE